MSTNNTQGSPSSVSTMSLKGKEKVEESETTILNSLNVKETRLDKGKEVAVVIKDAESNNDNKRKAIEIPDSDDEDSKNPKSDDGGGELGRNWSIADLLRGNENGKNGYACLFCAKIFPTPQALGGHQNGHKWERKLKLGPYDEASAINSSNQLTTTPPPPPLPIPPHYQQQLFIGGNHGVTLTPMMMPHQVHYHHHPHHPHHPHPQHLQYWPNANYGRVGNGPFNHPIRPPWLYPGNYNTNPHYMYPQNAAGFNAGFGHAALIEHRHYHHPGLTRFHPGIGHNNNNNGGGGINNYGVNQVRESENNGGGNSKIDFVLLPGRVNCPMVRDEIDFGLVQNRNGEASEDQEE